jgi:ParB family chromosome partitioning protein
MTTGIFETVPIDLIRKSDDRQRRDLGDLSALALSIRRNGLIHPIVVTRDLMLVAGECRLEASRLAELPTINVQYVEDLPREELEILELEENVKRKELSWQEYNAAVIRYHRMNTSRDPEWSLHQSAEALGMSENYLVRHLLVNREIEIAGSGVQEAPAFTTALNITRRRIERRKADTLSSLIPSSAPEVEEMELPPRPVEFLHANFLEWQASYSGPPFNFIHFDPPYGINYHTQPGQGTVHDTAVYEDTPEVYFTLLDTLLAAEHLLAPQCHMMLWFAMDHYEETRRRIQAAGWRIDKRPLIWLHSDNAGILPDVNRGPRWIYDTALMCTRGDRKIASAVANAIASPTTREFHSSEKPLAVLDHFFRMFVDESSHVLDPTAGSAMALRAAEARGARRVLGLEILEENYKNGRRNLGLE